SDKSIGNIGFVDASDPLKILLFYRDFGQIRFLDNSLSPQGNTILLDNIGFGSSTMVCSSDQNGIWLYEPVSFKLTRLDK
ncbi:hypothetical protein MEO41_29325, partial [Dolichospermum sp. ST_sed4]|nr:hypothetical protein [Dolichospermum sp. ST_sed4]